MTEITISNTDKWFFFVLIYLVIDYVRPQDLIPVLRYLKLGMFINIILIAFLVFKGNIQAMFSKQTKMIWLFILLLSLYVPFAVNNFWAFETVKGMLLFMPFILSTIICISSMKRLRTTIFVCVCIMLYIALYSLSHNGMGSGNYFRDENDLALFINMWLPFCYYLMLDEKDWNKKIVYAAGLIAGLMSLVMSFSRGGLVGLLTMSVVLWIFNPRKILTVLVISLVALLMINFGSQSYWSKMATTTHTGEGTASERILSWKSGWDMFLDNPLGVGGNNFQTRFPEYQGNRFHKGMWGRVAHSIWFTLIPETGIFGILIYFMLLYYNLKDVFFLKHLKAYDTNPDARYLYILSLALLASLAGYFASATFLSVLYYPHYWYMTGIIVAAVNVAHKSIITNESIS